MLEHKAVQVLSKPRTVLTFGSCCRNQDLALPLIILVQITKSNLSLHGEWRLLRPSALKYGAITSTLTPMNVVVSSGPHEYLIEQVQREQLTYTGGASTKPQAKLQSPS